MDGGVLNVLIFASQRDGDECGWPSPALLDRLERHGVHPQVLCRSRNNDLMVDPRAIEFPILRKRWPRFLAARRIGSDRRLTRPDLLHVTDDDLVELGLALSETGRLPYVQTVAGFDTVERGLRLSRRWCRRLVATNPDLVSELTVELGIPRRGIALVPPGLPARRANRSRDRGSSIPVIGAGGPVEGSSGLLTFLEAARLVVDKEYDVEFVIAGHARDRVALRHYARGLQIAERVTVADYPTVGPDFWSVLDIYCQPAAVASTGEAVIQALAHGIPCITTSVPGLRVLIDPGETGLIIPPAQPVALQHAILSLLDQPDQAYRLGRKGLECARTRFDLDTEADRLAALYRDVAVSCASPWFASA
jgi:glycosyltransferase involved in cell wall biosynthesis